MYVLGTSSLLGKISRRLNKKEFIVNGTFKTNLLYSPLSCIVYLFLSKYTFFPRKGKI